MNRRPESVCPGVFAGQLLNRTAGRNNRRGSLRGQAVGPESRTAGQRHTPVIRVRRQPRTTRAGKPGFPDLRKADTGEGPDLSAGGKWIRTFGSRSETFKLVMGRRDCCLESGSGLCWGTESSNPFPSSGESVSLPEPAVEGREPRLSAAAVARAGLATRVGRDTAGCYKDRANPAAISLSRHIPVPQCPLMGSARMPMSVPIKSGRSPSLIRAVDSLRSDPGSTQSRGTIR